MNVASTPLIEFGKLLSAGAKAQGDTLRADIIDFSFDHVEHFGALPVEMETAEGNVIAYRDICDALGPPICEILRGHLPEVTSRQAKGDWKIASYQDGDGHLSLFVSHKDGTACVDVGAELGNDDEFGVRLTSQGIEDAYRRA